MTVSHEQVLDALRAVQDPDLKRNIVELEFVKALQIDEHGGVRFDLELTTPACPVKDQMRDACTRVVEALPGVTGVEVRMTARTRGAPTMDRAVLRSVGNIVAVASGKGGVAKSTTAVNLAVALKESGARVGILDADIYGPSVPTMLRIEEEPTMGPDQRIHPARALGMQVISMGFFIPQGRAAILRGPMVSGYVQQFLGNVNWGTLDYLIVDYPPGTGDIQLTLSQQAPITGAVVCTTPQEISLIDVQKAVAMFEATHIPVLGVVETMSYFICDGCNKRHDIFRRGGGERVAAAAGVPFLGGVPIDPAVAQSGDQGAPIVLSAPESVAAQAYREIAGAAAAQLSVLNVERGAYLESFSLKWDL